MTIREMVLAELIGRELRVPTLPRLLRKRRDLRWRQRLYLLGGGTLYVDMVGLEDDGLVESVKFIVDGIQLERWRISTV